MIEITEEMLDAIEAVKGRREPQYWDHQCRRYLEKQKNLKNLSKDELEKKYQQAKYDVKKDQKIQLSPEKSGEDVIIKRKPRTIKDFLNG